MSCPLCLNKIIDYYYRDKVRKYWQCANCQLVFVKPENYLSARQEKSVYDLHQNAPEDLGYRNFLNKLIFPLSKRIKKEETGLDFGCGPGPTTCVMLKEQGITMENYDIFYANKPELLKRTYDFITCTEVIEHIFKPCEVITVLSSILKTNGLLGIMTKRVISLEKFKNWHYKNDLTHVCFYSDETFSYIANTWGYELDFIDKDVVILKKY